MRHVSGGFDKLGLRGWRGRLFGGRKPLFRTRSGTAGKAALRLQQRFWVVTLRLSGGSRKIGSRGGAKALRRAGRSLPVATTRQTHRRTERRRCRRNDTFAPLRESSFLLRKRGSTNRQEIGSRLRGNDGNGWKAVSLLGRFAGGSFRTKRLPAIPKLRQSAARPCRSGRHTTTSKSPVAILHTQRDQLCTPR